MSIFESISPLPPDPIFGLASEYTKDPRQNKFTFVTGYYHDESLKTPLLDVVAEVEDQLAEKRLRREYLPIDGDREFVEEVGKLVFGTLPSNMYGIQTVGGTGALFLIGELAAQFTDQIAISNPTWANHWGIFSFASLKTIGYPYYEKKKIPFSALIEKLESLPKRAAVLLHTNAHNPTSLDLSQDEWIEIANLVQKKGLFPILDMAYQGFSQEPEKDAFAPRLFVEKELEFALTYTCAKNFSIYGERAGALFVIANTSKMEAVQSQLKRIARGSYSNPPAHAAYIVKSILQDETLKKRWLQELSHMRQRMQTIRNQFIQRLMQKNPQGNWDVLKKGTGLFLYSDLSPEKVAFLRKEKGLYLAADGRINLTGLNNQNIGAFVEAFLEVL